MFLRFFLYPLNAKVEKFAVIETLLYTFTIIYLTKKNEYPILTLLENQK